jgi:hypothetical protein
VQSYYHADTVRYTSFCSEGDLIVIEVSAGAELLAAGHIHVYGVLRGGEAVRMAINKPVFLPAFRSRFNLPVII